MSPHLSRTEFEKVVEEAVASLPEEFASLLENVVIVVEEEPTDEDYAILDEEEEDEEYGEELDGDFDETEAIDEDDADHGDSELLGIYRGAPRTVRTHDMLPMLPDQIAIFRGPILRVASTRREAVREVRDTVIHELGHYFGLDDDGMAY